MSALQPLHSTDKPVDLTPPASGANTVIASGFPLPGLTRGPGAAEFTPSVTAEEFNNAWASFRQHAIAGRVWTGRYELRYFTWGQGQPVVFIHGMADAPEAFVMVVNHLWQRHRCVAYALPNGQTDGACLARYRLTDYLADLNVLLDHLRLDQVTVVGSSFGSLITLYALAYASHRCVAGVLQNGFAHRPLGPAERQLARWGRRLPGWFADWPNLYRWVMQRLEPSMCYQVPAPVAQLYLHHGSQTPLATAAWRAWTIAHTDLRPLLPTIQQPVLLITADRDRLVPSACWDEVQRPLPHCRRVTITGCGHYPQYTHPTEMALAIQEWVERVDSQSHRQASD
ncbi:MAG: alpha/beta hydrolase [Gemmataceae bacterium]|nr:alpha/beta hydrolase [Gemmataceae bacterium]MDW8243210.1 alpha/beta hydrolase [Thermogemmata sp.]